MSQEQNIGNRSGAGKVKRDKTEEDFPCPVEEFEFPSERDACLGGGAEAC